MVITLLYYSLHTGGRKMLRPIFFYNSTGASRQSRPRHEKLVIVSQRQRGFYWGMSR